MYCNLPYLEAGLGRLGSSELPACLQLITHEDPAADRCGSAGGLTCDDSTTLDSVLSHVRCGSVAALELASQLARSS